ncbi:hypothetical protein ACLBWZ_13305 [Brucellaceae bacterium C25G]
MSYFTKHTFYMLALLLPLSITPSSAANWNICDLTVQVEKPHNNEHKLFTKVISVKAKNSAECPNVGDALHFDPETEDYQSMIPRKNWPKPNKIVPIRYRYLDGVCKSSGPCRIRHYSLMEK